MTKKTIRNLLLILILFFFSDAVAQNTHEVNIIIKDTLIKGRDYPYATKVNIEINVINFQNTVFLYYFHNPVSSLGGYGLSYILEDKNHNRIQIRPDFYSILYKDPTSEPKCMSTGFYVNSKQKIIRKNVPGRKSNDYDLAKYEVISSKQNDAVYLMLSWYHKDLPKGEYYLYLTYSFNPKPQYQLKYIVNDSRTFKGNIVSNKVKLIVE